MTDKIMGIVTQLQQAVSGSQSINDAPADQSACIMPDLYTFGEKEPWKKQGYHLTFLKQWLDYKLSLWKQMESDTHFLFCSNTYMQELIYVYPVSFSFHPHRSGRATHFDGDVVFILETNPVSVLHYSFRQIDHPKYARGDAGGYFFSGGELHKLDIEFPRRECIPLYDVLFLNGLLTDAQHDRQILSPHLRNVEKPPSPIDGRNTVSIKTELSNYIKEYQGVFDERRRLFASVH